MKIGFTFRSVHWRYYSALAAKGDELGFESLWMPEHLVFPREIPNTYLYSADGVPRFTSRTGLYDPWVVLAFAAAASQNLRLGTAVYILPLRNPFVTARAVSTLDLLSNGRVILGSGIGWLQPEFEAVGEAWKSRAGRTTEIVEILKKLWTEEVIEYHGKHYDFGPVKFEPKPVQQGGPPIQFGGETPQALRRAAQLGDGWISVAHSPKETGEFVRTLEGLRKEAGRDKEPFEVTVAAPEGVPTVDELRRYEEVGVNRVNVVPWEPPEGRLTLEHATAGMEEFADRVLSKVG